MPIFLLYLSLAASLGASQPGLDAHAQTMLTVLSRVFNALFFGAQFLAAWYLTRVFFARSSSPIIAALKYIGVLTGALLCSLCGAVACESFGYVVLLRFMRRGM